MDVCHALHELGGAVSRLLPGMPFCASEAAISALPRQASHASGAAKIIQQPFRPDRYGWKALPDLYKDASCYLGSLAPQHHDAAYADMKEGGKRRAKTADE